MARKELKEKTYSSDTELTNRRRLVELLRTSPIPDDQLLSNLGLFLEAKNLARILFMDFLFKQIVDVQGVVIEFGSRWGQNLALFSSLRGIYDPFNRHRKVIGFDTFTGFPSISAKDGKSDLMVRGRLAVSKGYEHFLSELLQTHEQLNPLSHIRKFEVRRGDAAVEVPRYLKENPETIVALAYFDFDLYEPTRKSLELIRPRLTKGSVLAFDELNDHDSPGETRAVMETLGIDRVRLKRFPQASRASYIVLE